MSVTVATRTVVTFGDKPSDIWVLPNDNVVEIDGEPFVTLGYGGDRGFARFVGGDLGASNPLARFRGWATPFRRAMLRSMHC